MLVSGREIAERILLHLQKRVDRLQQTFELTPHLAVIRVGSDPAIDSYIAQKKRMAEKIGAIVSMYPYPEHVTEDEILERIHTLQKDNTLHGIILQLPLPKHLYAEKLIAAIDPKYDIDGFHSKTKFPVPVAQAVLEILREIHFQKDPFEEVPLLVWLQTKDIAVLGKGKTAGKPVIDLLHKMDLHPVIIDTKTKRPKEKIKQADMLICCVGKKHLVTKIMLKRDVILIGVGMNKDESGKFIGDYDEEDIKDVASYYTPIPGGVGPINVAKLMENLVAAAESSIKN